VYQFRVPYRLCRKRARNKAVVACYEITGPDDKPMMVPSPGAKCIEFEAPSFRAASRQLELLILPADKRRVMNRHMVRCFVIGERLRSDDDSGSKLPNSKGAVR
jgi:hypothetical protein